MKPFVFATSMLTISVKPPDGDASKPIRPSFWDIFTKDQGATNVKEKVDRIENGLMKVFLKGEN